MDVCRICLSDAPTKYVHQLQTSDKSGHIDHLKILRFCLEIKFTEESTVVKKLCTKCFKKILIFYKFKSMALENDAYLKSIDTKSWPIKINKKSVREIEKIEVGTGNNEIHAPHIVYTESGKEKCIKNEIYYIEEDLIIVPHQAKVQSLEDSLEYEIKDAQGEINDIDKDDLIREENEPECYETFPNTEHSETEETNQLPQDIIQLKKKRPPKKIKHCTVCNKDVADLVGHLIRIHHRELCKYICKLCGLRFRSPSLLDLHGCKKAKDVPRPFQCDICQRQYISQRRLNVHVHFTHPKERPFMCQFCSKTFAANCRLTKHLRIHTNEKPYKCPICEKCFTHHAALYRHKFLHKEEKTFHCTQCDKSYFNSSGLRNHMEYHKQEKDLPCRFCGALFLRYSQRYAHEHKEHNRTRGRRADSAGSRAPGATSSRAPYKTAKTTRGPLTKEESYLCQLCSMTFTRKSQLTFHLKYHGQERPHKCTECPKSYLTTKGLEYHYQFAHTDNKQFQCTLCAKNFSSPKYLRQHMVSHSEEKAKYHCKYCGVCFTRVDTCKAHQKKVHEKKELTFITE